MTINNERDTKFSGFAALVLGDLSADIVSIATDEDVNIDNLEHMAHIIAQRAYDLACHVIGKNMGGSSSAIQYYANSTPDLTEWPPTIE